MNLVRDLSDLAVKEQFWMNIGPEMMNDSDDTKSFELLAEALSAGLRFNGSLITAGEDGVHWNAVSQAPHLIKYGSQHSPHGWGSFEFGALAMVKPDGPFYPGSYSGGGHHFAIGLESAGLVAEVFVKHPDPRTAEQAPSAAPSGHLAEVEAIAMKNAAEHKS
jgi:uncharacterized protein